MEKKVPLKDSYFTHCETNVSTLIPDDKLLEILDSVRINPLEEIPPPPICLRIENNNESSTICTLGNFSLIIGKAKSRKTFFITIALAAASKNSYVLSRFKGILPQNQKEVMFFDTEQGKYHVLRTVQRVCCLIGGADFNNFKAYGLRKFSPSERLNLIEKAIYSNDNLGFVVIDGVRDLVTSINDEEQATMLTSKFLKWTEERNLHIVCVLHQNKGDNNARGHLGSELQNKAETVLTVAKDENNKNISIVAAEFCRDKEPDSFAFEIDDNGMPFLIEDWEAKSGSPSLKKQTLPVDFPITTHTEILSKIFKNQTELTYSDFCTEIQSSFALYSIPLGKDKAKLYISHYVSKGYVSKKDKQKGNKTFYSLITSQELV